MRVCVACIYHNYSAKCNQWVRLWSRYDIESCALSVCRIWLYQVGLSMDRQCVHVCWCMCSVVYTGSAPFIWYLERRTSARNNYYVFALHCTRMQTGSSGKKNVTLFHTQFCIQKPNEWTRTIVLLVCCWFSSIDSNSHFIGYFASECVSLSLRFWHGFLH